LVQHYYYCCRKKHAGYQAFLHADRLTVFFLQQFKKNRCVFATP
jgi:hypothetical protein